MNKKISCLALCAMLFALCGSVQAQQRAKIPRVGMAFRTEAFRHGLRGLGYVEGKNIGS